MPYLDYFFTEKCLLHSKILQIIPHSLIFYELNAWHFCKYEDDWIFWFEIYNKKVHSDGWFYFHSF